MLNRPVYPAACLILMLSMTLALGGAGCAEDPGDAPAEEGASTEATMDADGGEPAGAEAGPVVPGDGGDGQAVLHPDADPAPAFTLPDTHGNDVSLADHRGAWVLLEWINHDCPFVRKFYNADKMQSLQRTYTDRDVVWLSIASSAPGKQGHESPERWNELTEETDAAPTAVLIDEEGEVGRSYNARTTPQIVVIDPQGRLIYNGGIDSISSANPDDIDRADNYVVEVLDAVLAGDPAPVRSSEPYGCAVHY